jgi:hypothetical protein
MVLQFTPFQKERNGEEPSDDLNNDLNTILPSSINKTYRPPAKILLEFPSSTATAVTGPGISPVEPTADQVELSKENMATLDTVPSASAIEPDANSNSWLS